MSSRRLISLLVLGLAVLGLISHGTPSARAEGPLPIDPGDSTNCLGLVPYPPAPTLGRPLLRADIVVALDGVSVRRARQVMTEAAKAYLATSENPFAPNIQLHVIRYDDLTELFLSSVVRSLVVDDVPSGDDMMSTLIRYYNLKYPDLRRDAVHLLTADDIGTVTSGQRDNSVAGITNCIGSIGTRFAFSVAEVGVAYPIDVGPMQLDSDIDAKVTAHELGHVFGAQHHYAECTGPSPQALLAHHADTCSLMFNDGDVIDLRFNPVEAAVIRGFAEAQLRGR